MFIAAVHVWIKPDKIDEFKQMIRANHEGAIREPGCLRFDVAQSNEDPTEFILWEAYVDEDASKFHKTTPHYLAFKEQASEFMARERVSDLYTGIYPATVAGA